jgi:hypothetical protein
MLALALNKSGTGLLKPARNDLPQRWPVSLSVNSEKAPAADANLDRPDWRLNAGN